MNYDYSKYHPKGRTGKECKKTNCARYESYRAWNPGNGDLRFCMECRNAHVSQFKKKNMLPDEGRQG